MAYKDGRKSGGKIIGSKNRPKKPVSPMEDFAVMALSKASISKKLKKEGIDMTPSEYLEWHFETRVKHNPERNYDWLVQNYPLEYYKMYTKRISQKTETHVTTDLNITLNEVRTYAADKKISDQSVENISFEEIKNISNE